MEKHILDLINESVEVNPDDYEGSIGFYEGIDFAEEGYPETHVVVIEGYSKEGERSIYYVPEEGTKAVMEYYNGEIDEVEAFKKILEANNISEENSYLLIESKDRDQRLLTNLSAALASVKSAGRKKVLQGRITTLKRRIADRKEKMKLAIKKEKDRGVRERGVSVDG